MNFLRLTGIIYAVLFVILISILSIHNRPAADDFYYLTCVPQSGIISCVAELYKGYSARWTAYTLAALIIPVPWLYHFLPVIITLIMSALLAAIIRLWFLRQHAIRMTLPDALLCGMVLCSAFFFTTFSVAESWFWIIQVCTYLMSMLAQMMLLYSFLSEKKNYWILLPAAVFIGGSSESYAVIVLLILLAGLTLPVVRQVMEQWFPTSDLRNKLSLALAGCLSAFVVTMASKGNLVRYEALPHAPLPDMMRIILSTWAKAAFFKPLTVLPYYLLFGWLTFAAGRRLSQSGTAHPGIFIRRWLKSLMLLLAAVLVLILPATIILSGLPPDRALLQVCFLITSFVLLFFLDAGSRLAPLPYERFLLRKPLALILPFVLIYHITTQSMISARYAWAVDDRLKYLHELKMAGNTSPVNLPALPSSGWLYAAEISSDTSHFTNQWIKKYLNLEFPIARQSP
jgi:hypothetical protein